MIIAAARVRWSAIIGCIVAAWLWGASTAVAAPPSDDSGGSDAGEVEPPAGPVAGPTQPETAPSTELDPSVDAALRLRAKRIRTLLDGTLEPEVDATTLLTFDLADAAWLGTERMQRILSALADAAAAVPPDSDPSVEPPVEVDPPVPPGGEPPDAAAELEAAVLAFLRKPAERRAALLAAHEERRAAAEAARTAATRDAKELDRITLQAEQLEAYLAGNLAPEVDPMGLLQINLATLGTAADRRASWLGRAAAPDAVGPGSPELRAAQIRLDGLHARYLALTAEEKKELAASHARRATDAKEAAEVAAAEEELEAPTEEEVQTAHNISDAEATAEEAALAQERVLEAARKAKTEAKRIIGEETGRLLGIKSSQALYEAEINRRKAERPTNHEKALEWSRRVNELESAAMYSGEKAEAADPMYEEIRTELSSVRERLADELERIRGAGEDVPAVGEGLDRNLPADVDRGDIPTLRAELEAKHAELIELEREVGWELAKGLRDDVVLLNRARLALLELASSDLRESVTGFGHDGVDQVKRELQQIGLELSFLVMRLSRYRQDLVGRLGGSTIPLMIGLTQFAVVLIAFVWWRRRSPELLDAAYASLREGAKISPVKSYATTLLWYLRRVRRPLELLLLLWIMYAYVVAVDDLPEFVLAWIVAVWVLAGLAVILFVDALAARETQFSTSTRDNSRLRIHSLRVVGINVIAVGLLLSLTSAMVGQGAIYSWVLSTCWLLTIPVALYLVRRWQPIIFESIEARVDQNGFTHWVKTHEKGAVSFPAALAAAVFLLGGGVASWVMRQLSGLEATRRLLAYLFRREVAKQAAATEADGRYTPIDRKIYDVFDPERQSGLVDVVGETRIASVAALAKASGPTLSTVVAERGGGKSVFVERLVERIGPEMCIRVECPEEGYNALLAKLGTAIGKTGLTEDGLSEALRGLGHRVVIIDDLQRLVVPAVNGLAELDRFTTLARNTGGEVSWVVTIGSAAWHYVRRARGDRVFFEQVVELAKWKEERLGELIKLRCAEAEIDPSFDGLVVPRQAQAPLPDGGDRTEAGYYRLLWDFSRGNPGVALHAFRESLFVAEDGKVVVRLFREPPPGEIEDLSLTLLFVLRTIVQLELARPDEIVAATQLPRNDVDDALRFCTARGYIYPYQGGVRLGWPWYRTITTVLQRQHLLSSL